LIAKAVQHLQFIVQSESVPSVRTEARRALRDFNGGINGKNGTTSTRARKPKAPPPSDDPTNAD